MVTRQRKTPDPRKPGKEKESPVSETGAFSEEDCRCKEASKMTPRQLLEMMMGDLAFWKKAKKG